MAVTCAAGNVEARQVADNTRAVLELAGRSGRGGGPGPGSATRPAADDRAGDARAAWRSATPSCPSRGWPLSARHSADLIIEEARRAPGEITLVTLAPLTNLAVAVVREPELPRLLRGLVIMGGSYRSSGQHGTDDRVERGGRSGSHGRSCSPAGQACDGVSRPVALGLDVTERAKMTARPLCAGCRATAGDRRGRTRC